MPINFQENRGSVDQSTLAQNFNLNSSRLNVGTINRNVIDDNGPLTSPLLHSPNDIWFDQNKKELWFFKPINNVYSRIPAASVTSLTQTSGTGIDRTGNVIVDTPADYSFCEPGDPNGAVFNFIDLGDEAYWEFDFDGSFLYNTRINQFIIDFIEPTNPSSLFSNAGLLDSIEVMFSVEEVDSQKIWYSIGSLRKLMKNELTETDNVVELFHEDNINIPINLKWFKFKFNTSVRGQGKEDFIKFRIRECTCSTNDSLSMWKQIQLQPWFYRQVINDSGWQVYSDFDIRLPLSLGQGLPYEGYYQVDCFTGVSERNNGTGQVVSTEAVQIMSVTTSDSGFARTSMDVSPYHRRIAGQDPLFYNTSLQGSIIVPVTGATCTSRYITIRVTLPNGDGKKLTGGYIHIEYLGSTLGDLCS